MTPAQRAVRRLSLDRCAFASSTHFLRSLALVVAGLCVCGCREHESDPSGPDEPSANLGAMPEGERVPPGALGPSADSGGSANSARSAISPEDAENRAAAQRILKRMLDRYREANLYSDDAHVRLAYVQSGAQYVDTAPLSVAFKRGTALRLRAYAVDMAVVDGRLRATITDPAIPEISDQVMDVPVESPFLMSDVYSDPTATHYAVVGLGGPSPQLELLMADEPLAGLLEGDVEISLGEPAKIGEQTCDCLVISAETLRYVMWIRRGDSLLQRVELPAEGTPMAADPTVSNIHLSIELENARLSVSADQEWAPATAEEAVSVRRFVLPPPALPSEHLAQTPAPFRLGSLDEAFSVDQSGSDRPITVLMWIANHPASRLAAGALQSVADQWLATHPASARFMLVMAEPGSVGPEGTVAMLRGWNVGLAAAEDTGAVGRDVFGVRAAPALCVLGPEGTVEWFDPRVGPAMAEQLPRILADLQQGKSVAQEIRDQHRRDQETYHRLLDDARLDR